MNVKSRNSLYVMAIMIFLILLSGCATKKAYLKIEPSLEKNAVTINGTRYIPLKKICDLYGFECKWDTFIRTATMQKRSDRIVLRTGSEIILVNGEIKKLDNPVMLEAGSVMVPTSFLTEVPSLTAVTPPAEKAVKSEADRKFVIKRIVIDAGHGGYDMGAKGRRLRLKEKEIALSVARKVASILESRGIKVIMTRKGDDFIPLPKRVEIANNSDADLFVSIHINASRSRMMRGFECYYLSEATDDNARALEAVENASLKLDEEASAEHSRQLDRTLWDMTLSENRIESSELASYICDSVDRSFTMATRGVRSARFYVLKHTNMPAVLVEAGYISNRYEELKLKDATFLNRIADAVVEGIFKYQKEFERTEGFTRA